MPVLILICTLLAAAYAVLMLVYRAGWRGQQTFQLPADYRPGTRVSIIVPARNEAENIRSCIQSMLRQQYPAELVEILVVDDHSTDDTAELVQSLQAGNVRVLSLKDRLGPDAAMVAYKKKALGLGVAHSSGELIITTDADCIAPPGWLGLMTALYEREQAAMIIAPVDFTSNGSVVELFQSIDFMTMQGITAAARQLGLGNMANGANLAFSRVAFDAVDGYTGTDHLASGDDFLLLVKMRRRFPDGIHFLMAPGAIMATAPQPDWNSFLQQRVRWASKSGKYPDRRLTAILMLVYLFNLAFVPALIVAVWHFEYWWLPVGMLLLKVISELYFLFPVGAFFRKRRQLWLFPLLQPLHIAYIILAGFLGWVGHYEWKGRQVH